MPLLPVTTLESSSISPNSPRLPSPIVCTAPLTLSISIVTAVPSLGFGTIDGPLYVEKSLRYDPDLLSQPDGTTLVGYCQSWQYMDPIKNILLRELTLTRPRSDTYKACAAQILETPNSVAVHFRRRDAVDGSPGAKFHGTPSEGYYGRAIGRVWASLWARNRTCHWFMFSDDLQCVKDTYLTFGSA